MRAAGSDPSKQRVTPWSAASGQSARNAATARSSSASLTSSARMKKGTRMTSVPSSRAQAIACRTSACARLDTSGLASAIPPSSLCSPSTSAEISSPTDSFAPAQAFEPSADRARGRPCSRRPRHPRSRLASRGRTPPGRRGRRSPRPSPRLSRLGLQPTCCSRSSATGRPSSSAERQAARVSSSESRLWRAELYGSRFSAIAVTSSPIAPANPLVCQEPSSWKRVSRRRARARAAPPRARGPSRGRLRGSSPPSRGSRTACAVSSSPTEPTPRISALEPSS